MDYQHEPVAGIPPTGRAKNLRACLVCTLIQTSMDFRRNGCPNCEHFLQMRGNTDRVNTCTTAQFDGMTAIMNPKESWVARWKRVDVSVRGIYAVRLSAKISESLRAELDEMGITPRSDMVTEA
ncbi:transcription initiation Spt4 [Serendipita vermifera]|nr:transcription initiation Spt4 [Serendipita vermifera]